MSTALLSGGIASLAPTRFELSETLDIDLISAKQLPSGRKTPFKPGSIKDVASENIMYVFNLLRNIFSRFGLNLFILDELYKAHSSKLYEFSNKIDEDLKNIMEKYKDPRKRFEKILEYFDKYREQDNELIKEELKIINELILETDIPPTLLSNIKLFIEIDVTLDEILWNIMKDKLRADFNSTISRVYPQGRKEIAKKAMYRLIEYKYNYRELKDLLEKEKETRLSFIALIYALCIHKIKDKKEYFNVGIKYISWPSKVNHRKAVAYIESIFQRKLYEMTRQAAEYLDKAIITGEDIVNKEIWKNIVVNIIL